MKKRLIAIVCCMAMLVTMLAGCGNSGKEESKSSASSASKTSAAASSASKTSEAAPSSSEAAPTTISGVDGQGKKITIGTYGYQMMEDWNDNDMTEFFEEAFNIDIEFIELAASNDFTTKLSLMVSGGEKLPDIILPNLGTAAVLNYGTNGVFVPIQDYVMDPEISPNFHALSEEAQARLIQNMTFPDGNMYGLAQYENVTWNRTTQRLWINTTWLDKLGLEIPTTTDELYEVAKAFATQDPNGNGQKDEIAINGSYAGYGRNTVKALMNCFIYYQSSIELKDATDTVYAVVTDDKFREGIEYMRKLCQEGLMDPTVFTQDDAQTRALMNSEIPVVGFTASGNNTYFVTSQSAKEMEVLEPLSGPDGTSWSPYSPYSSPISFFITCDAEDPELCYRIGEYFYEPDMSMAGRWGTNFGGAEQYVYAEDAGAEMMAKYTNEYVLGGVVKAEELKGVILTSVRNDDPNSHARAVHWNDSFGPRYNEDDPWKYWATMEIGSASYNELKPQIDTGTYKTLMNIKYYSNRHPEKVLPALKYSTDATTEVGQIQTDVDTYVKTAMAEFITGERELNDSTWEAYKKDLESIGLSRWVELAQEAYDLVK